MARADSFTKRDMKKIAREHFREAQDYKNYVNREKSGGNYHMNTELKNSSDFMLATQTRVNAVMGGRDIQKQTNVISEWVISCPQELMGDAKQVEQFFSTAYEFCQGRYGKENVIDGFVHMDETTPHIHICLVPEATSRKTGRKTVSSASLLTRAELSSFHADLDKECERKFHKAKLVKNGKGKGNLELQQWKEKQAADQKHEQEIEQYRQFLARYNDGKGNSLLEVFDRTQNPVPEEKNMITEQEMPPEKPQEQPGQTKGPAGDKKPVKKPQKPSGGSHRMDGIMSSDERLDFIRKSREQMDGGLEI